MKISIFGTNNLEKSVFVRRILDILKIQSENYNSIKEIQNNYFEDKFFQNEKEFTITNVPYFPFLNNNQENIIDKEISRINIDKIIDSEKVILIFNSNDFNSENFSYISKFIEKRSKSLFFVYFDSFDKPFSNGNFSFKNRKFYKVPFYPLVNSREEIRNLLKNEFQISCELSAFKKENKSSIKSVIIGPPNSGKSSLLNSIAGYERSVVSSIEGTTKEEVKSNFIYKDWQFDIFDTEGVSNKKAVYSIDSIKNSDLIFMVIDVTKEVTKNILQIADTIQSHDSPLVIVLNKVDLVSKEEIKEKEKSLKSRLKSFSFVPIISLSATKRINFRDLFERIENIIIESNITISKRLVTSYANELVERNQPPLIRGKRLKFYYGFHEKGLVHKIIFFVNEPKCVHFSYQRYILNSFRKKMCIKYLPIKIFFKKS